MSGNARIELSPEQRAVVDTWGRGVAVMAGAGSGKTTTLVLKCIELLKRKPDARFAAVSFTERSASDLRAKLSEKLAVEVLASREGGPLTGHWVMTIHGLCGAIIHEFPREAGYDGGESMLAESEAALLWERAIQGLWFDDTLPEPVAAALDTLLERESRDGVHALLYRMRELSAFGAKEWLEQSDDARARQLSCLSAYVLERYQRAKRRNGSLDFNDLELGAERALESANVRQAFRERFDLVLVDEFQDTNPVQARIIRAFCREDLSNLCVVGDPKQSIYRFRDADVSLFGEFCDDLPERHSLTWNFRSRPGIIEYANAICALAFEEGGMAYEALVPKREPDPETEPVVRLEIREPAALARWIAEESERGVPLSDMALLVRRIRGNERWLKALSAAGIPIAVGSGGLFWEDPRVRELVAFLRWWDDPGNSLSAAVFLRAPWVAVPDAEIDAWVKADPTLMAPFFGSGHPLARALAPLRARNVSPSELLFALMRAGAEIPSLEAELGVSLLGLWHRMEELSSRGLGFQAVVREVARARDERRRERDVPPPRNQGQLQVLTLHSSKGLEFRHVILIDFGPKGRAPDAPMLFWDRAKGAFLAVRDEDGERDPKHPLESAWRAEESRKALAESMRLFYVALTRAQDRLILVCPELPPAKEPRSIAAAARRKRGASESAEASPFSADHWRAWIDHGPTPARTVTLDAVAAPTRPEMPARTLDQGEHQSGRQEHPVVRPRPPDVRVRYRRPRHSVTEWNLLSRCPRSYEWTYVRPREVSAGLPELGLFTGEKPERAAERELSQQELGSRVHGCLERGDYEGLKTLEHEVGIERFASGPVISWAMSADWMAPAEPSPPSSTHWRASERTREVWSELAFEVKVGTEVLVGSMDRVVLSGGSRVSLIDFKVTAKAKSVGALLEAYQTQMELYAFALKRLVAGSPYANATPEALLVNLAPGNIQSVPVPLRQNQDAPVWLAESAAAIVAGEEGKPKPGPLCRVCDFRGICPDGRA